MKSWNSRRLVILILLIFTFSLIFSACSHRQKELELSSNAKQLTSNEDGNSSKLMKERELELGNVNYIPIYWKDDDNIIAYERDKASSDYFSLNNAIVENINVYDINIKTLTATKINTITNAVYGYLGEREFSGNFLYLKDNKLNIYNAAQNTKKEIYDLSDAINEIKVQNNDKVLKDTEILARIHTGFVKGSGRYVYVMNYLTDDSTNIQNLRIIDLKTGGVSPKSSFANMFAFGEAYEISWVYSKANDSFYSASVLNNKLYQYKLGSPATLKAVKNIAALIQGISEDEKEVYLIVADSLSRNQVQKNSIMAYNIDNGNLTNLGQSKAGVLTSIKFNNSLNEIAYAAVDPIYPQSSELRIQKSMLSIGDFNGKSITNIKILPVELLGNESVANNILFNSKDNRFIYFNLYLDYSPSSTKLSKIKYYIYSVKK